MIIQGIPLFFILSSFFSLFLQTFGGDVKPRPELYIPNYKIYHNLSSLNKEITRLVAQNPNYIHLNEKYLSRNKASQFVLHLKNFSQSDRTQQTLSSPKQKVLLSFGEHAREFFPVESALYFLKNITAGLTKPATSAQYKFSRTIFSNLEIFIIVLANPDGRHYIEKTKNYCWRGTSIGVDLDRNFDWNFGGKGSSSKPFDEEYRGHSSLSEPECAPYVELTQQHHFEAFVSFHSGIRQIFIPFADSLSAKEKRLPDNADVQLHLAKRIAHASSQPFQFGVGYVLNPYPADGTIYDYMHGVRKIPFSLTIELWGEGDSEENQCFDLFNPTSEKLQGALDDVMPIFESLLTFLIEWKDLKTHQYYHNLEQPEFGLPRSYMVPMVAVSMLLLVIFHRHLPASLSFRGYQRRRVVSLRSLSSTFAVGSSVKIT
ncbi:putative carboxypeptidase A1 isoform X1 [Apostichopus japonicus]|uniref:Putative carboxypeptidase A1 isoform X1 n=1 Tax=Stichopus japonicus TaxID=307972 RepID=A0A2G8JBK0_STIJA|nr:putative carboxypeptidase A1 isoform X1 [Apostichopus japonicus]